MKMFFSPNTAVGWARMENAAGDTGHEYRYLYCKCSYSLLSTTKRFCSRCILPAVAKSRLSMLLRRKSLFVRVFMGADTGING